MQTYPIIFSRKTTRERINLSREFRRKMTKAEQLVWERLRDHRLNGLHFRRQVVIEPFLVDFYCHSLLLVVEINGEVHKKLKLMDAERDRYLNSLGLRVLRISNRRIMENIDLPIEQMNNRAASRAVSRIATPKNYAASPAFYIKPR